MSAAITIVCWGGFAVLVIGALVRDLVRDYRVRHPRCSAQPDYEAMVAQRRQIRALPEVEPRRPRG